MKCSHPVLSRLTPYKLKKGSTRSNLRQRDKRLLCATLTTVMLYYVYMELFFHYIIDDISLVANVIAKQVLFIELNNEVLRRTKRQNTGGCERYYTRWLDSNHFKTIWGDRMKRWWWLMILLMENIFLGEIIIAKTIFVKNLLKSKGFCGLIFYVKIVLVKSVNRKIRQITHDRAVRGITKSCNDTLGHENVHRTEQHNIFELHMLFWKQCT